MRIRSRPWDSRCPSSGATATACTTRAARSGSACGPRAPSCRRAPSESATRSTEAGARFVEAEPQPDAALHAVHDPALTDYLARAWADWEAAGLTDDPGQDRVVPYLFPHPALFSGFAPAAPAAASARAGLFAYDTMTLIGPGTWEAARAAVDVALTAAGLVADGERLAYALCRPPGHHVTRSAFGGSCYLNNSAAAAARLRRATGARVAVLDIDAHHGNGTQAIFWDDAEVLTGSVHVDPGAGWFPHFLGFAGETGRDGSNRNLPLAPGTGRRGLARGGGQARRMGRRARREARWWWRSAWTRRGAIPRARSR